MEMYQKGDRVWTLEKGFGTVDSVSTDRSKDYPVLVLFEDGSSDSFTKCGRRIMAHTNPVLFFEPFAVPEIKRPLPKLQVDTMVLVRDIDGGLWKRRYFSHFDESGTIRCFPDGANSWSVGDNVARKAWRYYEVVE